ncbi:MAG: ferrous iron transport protein A [Planctomycetota bacterium]|nr:ferrous iron transport protein A [Planctomycetota bacterium]
MLLSACRPGQGGRVTRTLAEGPLGQRLMEMGLIEGARVQVVRVAPLGDPVEIRLNDYHLSLRKAEAEGVEIEP